MAGVDGAGKTTIRSDPENGLPAERYFVINSGEIERAMAQREMIPPIDGLSLNRAGNVGGSDVHSIRQNQGGSANLRGPLRGL